MPPTPRDRQISAWKADIRKASRKAKNLLIWGVVVLVLGVIRLVSLPDLSSDLPNTIIAATMILIGAGMLWWSKKARGAIRPLQSEIRAAELAIKREKTVKNSEHTQPE